MFTYIIIEGVIFMESMNKFKVLTIIVLCMFFFVVAAIYTNTKDASLNKTKSVTVKETVKPDRESDLSDNPQYEELLEKYESLRNKINDLNSKFEESENNSNLNCRIYGTVINETPEALSPDVAIQDAKINNNDILIRCSMK